MKDKSELKKTTKILKENKQNLPGVFMCSWAVHV